MTDIFVVRNQLGHYWGKAKIWVDGSIPKTVLRTRHQDEAINTLFELSSRDIELRGEVVQTALSERGEPVIEPSQIPLLDEPAPDAPAPSEQADETVMDTAHVSETEPSANA